MPAKSYHGKVTTVRCTECESEREGIVPEFWGGLERAKERTGYCAECDKMVHWEYPEVEE